MVGAGWDRRGAIADFQVHPLLRLSGFEGLHYAEGVSLPGCSCSVWMDRRVMLIFII